MFIDCVVLSNTSDCWPYAFLWILGHSVSSGETRGTEVLTTSLITEEWMTSVTDGVMFLWFRLPSQTCGKWCRSWFNQMKWSVPSHRSHSQRLPHKWVVLPLIASVKIRIFGSYFPSCSSFPMRWWFRTRAKVGNTRSWYFAEKLIQIYCPLYSNGNKNPRSFVSR